MNKTWALFCNGELCGTYTSHTKARNALHYKLKEDKADMLDNHYDIKCLN